jgi:hypothetical protein
MRRLLPRGYLFTVLGIAVGVAGLVALGAMAERISRFIEGGDRFVLGQISVAGEGMGMGAGFTAGGLLRAAKIAEIARVPGVAAAQPQVMLPLKTTTSQFLTLTQELVLGTDVSVPMVNRNYRELPVRAGRFLQPGDRGVAVLGTDFAAARKLGVGGRLEVAGPFVEDRRRARQDADGARPVCDGDRSRTRATSGCAAIRSSSSSSGRAGSGARI